MVISDIEERQGDKTQRNGARYTTNGDISIQDNSTHIIERENMI